MTKSRQRGHLYRIAKGGARLKANDKRKGVWYISFRDFDGTQVNRCLHTEDDALAATRGDEFLADLDSAHSEIRFLLSLKIHLQTTLDRLDDAKAKISLPLCDAFKIWSEHPAIGSPSPSTMAGYLASWNNFVVFATAHNCITFANVKPPVVEAYVADQRANVSASTFDQRMNFLRGVFRLLGPKYGLSANPFDGVKSAKRRDGGGGGKRTRILTDDEITAIIEAATGWQRDMLAVMSQTGLDSVDIVTLSPDHLTMPDEMGQHRLLRRPRTKTGQHIALWLTDAAAAILYARGPRLFADAKADYMKSRARFSMAIRVPMETAKVKSTQDGRATLKSFRHTIRTRLALGGVPESVINKWMGHTGGGIGQTVYTHADDVTALQKAARFVPEIKTGCANE